MSNYTGDYIERDIVATFVEECGCSPKWIAKRIRNQEAFPAADVAPVRHSHWIPATASKNQNDTVNVFVCSNCHHFTQSKFVKTWNYCPNCGARMDKEAAHES